MANHDNSAFGFSVSELAALEGFEALAREAVDISIRLFREAAESGEIVTPTVIGYLLTEEINEMGTSAIRSAISAMAEMIYRLAFPREEMPPI